MTTNRDVITVLHLSACGENIQRFASIDIMCRPCDLEPAVACCALDMLLFSESRTFLVCRPTHPNVLHAIPLHCETVQTSCTNEDSVDNTGMA